MRISLSVEGINDYGNAIDFLVNPIQLDLDVRGCIEGEQYQDGLALGCSPCAPGFYYYDV